MKKAFLVIPALLFVSVINLSAQDTPVTDSSILLKPIDASATQKRSVYRIKNGIDIPLTVAGDAWSLYGMSVIYNRDSIPASEILALDRNDINKFDRPVSYNYSKKAAKASDYFFYGSMPLPLVLLFDKKIRRDGLKVGLLYLEAVGITGALYVTSAMLADRMRPYSYNDKADMSVRTRGGARNSFFAGHVAVVATSVFFTAQVYIDYHPEMKNKWILYSAAGALTATTGILRNVAGQHFYTDVALGVTVGTLSGLLTPYFHKRKIIKNSKITLLPNIRGASTGFTFLYSLDKKRNG
jgi:membrane-associated phospholipid phosphatase